MNIPDPLSTIREQLGFPPMTDDEIVPFFRQENPLPTEPGVYIIDRPHHHGYDHWWVGSAIFELSRTGYWSFDRVPLTRDEVDSIRHGQALVALVPTTEADL